VEAVDFLRDGPLRRHLSPPNAEVGGGDQPSPLSVLLGLLFIGIEIAIGIEIEFRAILWRGIFLDAVALSSPMPFRFR
jgi:hypothetical protein